MSLLEPAAEDEYGVGTMAVQFSQAISLKRIADALEQFLAMSQPEPEPLHVTMEKEAIKRGNEEIRKRNAKGK